MKRVMLKDGNTLPVEKLTMDELPEIRELQTKVIAHLPEKDFLQPLTDDEFTYILRGKGLLVGVRSKNRLIAFRALLDPGNDPEHLGEDAGISKEEWSSVLYSEITNVDPDFQGHGLQRQLGQIVMDTVDSNRYRYMCTTVSPYNIASMKDKFALGLYIVALNVKYETLTRYIMMKDLKVDVQVTEEAPIVLSMGATEEQQRVLKDGWIGTRMEQVEDDWIVYYEKRKS